MTTVIPNSNHDVTTPNSYVSRWIAQSQVAYPKRNNGFYSLSSSYDCPISGEDSFIRSSANHHPQSPKTTWKAQARSRFDPSNYSASCHKPSIDIHDHELQEKLQKIRNLLEVKKKRFCRHVSSAPVTPSKINPAVSSNLSAQVHCSNVVGDSPLSSPPLLAPPTPSIPALASSNLALENGFHTNDETISSSNNGYAYNSCSHHHQHPHHPSLPCLVEESPSDSGLSDGTKVTHHDDIIDSTNKNAAIIDLSKPLSKEEMLAIMQIIRELWRKQFDCEIPNIELPTIPKIPAVPRRSESISNLSNKTRNQYHSSPSLDKLTAELSDIKDKLKRFNIENKQKSNIHSPMKIASMGSNVDQILISDSNKIIQEKSIERSEVEQPVFVSLGEPLTPKDLERMQAKKDALMRRQIQRREEQLMKKSQRQMAAAERHNEYRLFEEYLAQRRADDEQRRSIILRAHLEQKRHEADPPRRDDYYFSAARRRNQLNRKTSLSSFLSCDDDFNHNDSSFDIFANRTRASFTTPKRSLTQFDIMSPSLTAPTRASRSKINRITSICQADGPYESMTSLNSKATRTFTRQDSTFGGSLMNLSKSPNLFQTPKRPSIHLIDDLFEGHHISPLSISMNSLAGTRVNRSQTFLTTKSNKQTILNSLKQVALAGSANDRQREVIIREIELSEARHFVLLFRDHRLQFRAVYMYLPETDIIEKVHGIGPNIITEIMVDKWYKYNSGSKRFANIPIKHFSIQCDAVIIYNDFWPKNSFRR